MNNQTLFTIFQRLKDENEKLIWLGEGVVLSPNNKMEWVMLQIFFQLINKKGHT